jgi:methionyl-tRNA formyltransferase
VEKQNMRIVFMGTPEFAVASLRALLEAGFDVVGVITAPDKPAGRGLKLSESAVKQYAVARGLYIMQPEKLKDPGFIDQLRELKADIQVVVAFRMLPEIVWNMPPKGTINLHGSLLPKYRGAAPINWAVINGETETGVTTFRLQHQIDTGNILLQQAFPVGPDETAGEVHDRMMMIGADVLVETIREIADGTLQDQPQPVLADAPHAPKIFTETCRIDWSQNLDRIYNLIRGLSPHPGAFTNFDEKICKILRVTREPAAHNLVPGSYQTDGKTFLKFVAPGGYLNVLELQIEGKRKMNIADFLRGFRPRS